MTLHNYRFRKFHRTSHRVNLSSSFRDTHSGQAHMGQMDKCPWCCTTTSKANSIEWRKSIQQFQRYAFQLMYKPIWVKWASMDKPILIKLANDCDAAQLQIEAIPYNFEWSKSVSGFRSMHSSKTGPQWYQIWPTDNFVPRTSSYGANEQMTTTLHNFRSR